MKRCRKCKSGKPKKDFYFHSGTLDGLGSWCKKCVIRESVKRQRANPEKIRATQKRWRDRNPEKRRAKCRKFAKANPEKVRAWDKAWRDANPDKIFAKQLRRHGITPKQYNELFLLQGRACAICSQPCKSGKRLAVDHIHGSSPVVIRGLLCRDCNTSLGKFKDSSALLRKALEYLENAENKTTNKTEK